MTLTDSHPILPRFSRREILRSLGVGAIASPFLPLLNASGQEALFPRRLVLFFTPHGTIWDAWKPRGTERDFTLGPILKPLERHKSKINVLANLTIADAGPGPSHTRGAPLLWTGSPLIRERIFVRSDAGPGAHFGWNAGPSVDQVIARVVGNETPYRSLELGVRCEHSHPANRTIYAGPRQPIPPEGNPYTLFERLFVPGGAYERLRRLRKSTLDVMKGDLDRVRSRVGAGDREKIEQHAAALRTLEARLERKPVACPQARGFGDRIETEAAENTPLVLECQTRLLAAALACDVTRVASLQHRVADIDDDRYTWLGLDGQGHHKMSHAGDSDLATRAKLVRIYTWYAERFAALLDALDAVPEGNGTLLDNTLVVWGSELGKGNNHSFERAPFVTAGGSGGAVRTGRFVELPDRTPHNRLLVSICHAMGLKHVESFGTADPGRGPLPL